MQKDVIYIDVEDDITAIIGKVKNSKEKVVALVPPKRIGVLQSAVNLRLLARTAGTSHKHLVLITNNQALLGLSASAKIPVAKNLQSKPEMAEIPALDIDNGDDIIDGAQLPVGELARTADGAAAAGIGDQVSDKVLASIENDDPSRAGRRATPPKPGEGPGRARIKNGVKVPSFDIFRKKLLIFSGLGVLFVAFLIWAIFFAPSATVVISARTTGIDIKTPVAIGPTLANSIDTSTLKSAVQQDKQSSTIEFDATGTQDVGEKATGQVKLSVLSITPTAVPAGTALTSTGGLVFVTTAAATIPASVPCFPTFCAQDVTVAVAASASGTKYNGASGSLSGAPASATAQFTAPTAGGTEKIIKIVLQADVEKAKAQLVSQSNDEAKKKLIAKFTDNTLLIEDSFQTTPASPVSAPAVGQESKDGKAKLTSEVTYSMSGVAKGDLSAFLKSALEKQIDRDQQRVYADGSATAKLTGFTQNNGNTSVTITTTGQVGPKIDDNKIKEQVKGKNFGEIQTELKAIEGISDADTKFWPFWVSSVPDDTKKIKIEFKLQNESKS